MLESPENQVWHALSRNGFRLLRGGWPDFMVLAPDQRPLVAVEVKGPRDRVSYEQKNMIRALQGLGVEVHVLFTENGGIRRFVRDLAARFLPKREPPMSPPMTSEEEAAWQEQWRRAAIAMGYPPPVFTTSSRDNVDAFCDCRKVL